MTNARRQWSLAAGSRYFGTAAASIDALVPEHDAAITAADLIWLDLPGWADGCALNGKLPAFRPLLAQENGHSEPWRRCDWLAVAAHLIYGTLERQHEAAHGPVLSYSPRLPEIPAMLFDRAWANRIFLFLRQWAAREAETHPDAVFGPLPPVEIVLTHDVDAINLTPEIRFKQAAFDGVNALRALAGGKVAEAGRRIAKGLRFVTAPGDLRTLSMVRDLERAAGLTSIFHFYAGPAGLKRRHPRKLLIDPAYDIAGSYLGREIAALRDGGWTVGLHQSFDTWETVGPMLAEKRRLEAVAGPVSACRQHWLHFSWQHTWQAQAAAGLALDSTLGFNDRPGFRASHALRLPPWDAGRALPMDGFEIVPMLFMDSHFYEYGRLSGAEVGAAIKPWLDEVRAVRGIITVNWHTQTLTDAYGWRSGYEGLLAELA